MLKCVFFRLGNNSKPKSLSKSKNICQKFRLNFFLISAKEKNFLIVDQNEGRRKNTSFSNTQLKQWFSTLRYARPGVDPTKLFFLHFFFFGVKLGHFTINKFFSVYNKNASLPL